MKRRTLVIILVSLLVIAVGTVILVLSLNRLADQNAADRVARGPTAAQEPLQPPAAGPTEAEPAQPQPVESEPEHSIAPQPDSDTPEQPRRTDYPDGKSSGEARLRVETPSLETAAEEPGIAEPVLPEPPPAPEHNFADLLRWSGVLAYAPPPARPAPPEPAVEPIPEREPEPEPEAEPEPEPEPEVEATPTGLRLVVTTPLHGESYQSRIDVRGAVGYEQNAPDSLALPVVWQLDATDRQVTVMAQADGTFAFSIPTAGFDQPILLTISARDELSNSVEFSLTLHPVTDGPNLVISSPSECGRFADEIVVEGEVGNSDGNRGETSEVRSLSVLLPLGGEEVDFASDGSFVFRHSPTPETVAVELLFEASDFNGNTTRRNILLSRAPPGTDETAGEAEGPFIRIDSPTCGGFYRDLVRVSGQVSDDVEMSGTVDSVSALYYFVPGVTPKPTLIFFEDDGSFELEVGVGSAEGPIQIQFSAEGVSGSVRAEAVAIRDGNRLPQIVLSSPVSDGQYGSGILIAGSILDPYRDFPEYGGIDHIEYLIAPDEVDGESFVEFAGSIGSQVSGQYRVEVPAKTFAGDCRIELQVFATNGNTSKSTLQLHEGDSDIPSLVVSATDGGASAMWSAVPFAADYTLAAADPINGSRSGVSTTSTAATIANLENGHRYRVLLEADTSAAGYESTSHTVDLIPMAADTLGVKVAGEFEQIRITWNAIPGSDSFVVSRSPNGVDFSDFATVIEAEEYLDTLVAYGTTYWYRVRPVAEATAESLVGSASPLAVPLVRSEVAGRLDSSIRHNLVVEGGYIVAANGTAGITLIDISDPTHPAVVSETETNNAHDVAVIGDHVYVADGDRGLRVVNIYSPTEPEIVGFRVTTNAVGVARSGDFVLVADDQNGVKVIDVSNPRSPVRVGSLEGFQAQDIAASDGLAVAAGGDGTRVIDISSPSRPVVLGSLDITTCVSVEFDGLHAYLACREDGLVILDVSDPESPAISSTIPDMNALSVRVAGGFAYVAVAGVGLAIYDVSNTAMPIPFDTVAAESARDVVVSGAHAYLVGDDSVDVIRTHLFGTSYPVASLVTGGRPYDIAIAGEYAFVAAHRGGLKVVDVTRPAAVTEASLVAEMPLPYAQAVVAIGDLAVVADLGGEIVIVRPVPDDSSDSGVGIDVIGSFAVDGQVSSLAAAGSTLFAAGQEIGIVVLDGANPADPVVIAEIRDYAPRHITLEGNRLYIAERNGDLVILDVSDPGNPTEISRYQSASVRSVAAVGDSVLLVTSGGVGVAQVESDGTVTLLSTIDARNVEDLIYTGSVAYIADGYRGIRVFSLSEPESPRQASAQSDTYAVGLAFKDGYLLVVDTEKLVVMEVIVPPWVGN